MCQDSAEAGLSGSRSSNMTAGWAAGFVRRMAMAAVCAASILAAPGLAVPANAQCDGADPSVPVTIEAKPITGFSIRAPNERRFGKVEFLGGLELTSSHRDFGGFSAIRVEPDGHFVSLTDRGWWLTGRIVYEGDRPAGIADARMAAMLGPDGRTLKARGWHDTESMAERDGFLYVGIERVNRIVRFDFAHCGFRARAAEYAAGARTAYGNLPLNKGLEALTFAPRSGPLSGTLIAFSERGLDAGGNLRAFLVSTNPAGAGTAAEFSVRRRDTFDISDSALLPSGDVLLLERRFSWWTGIAMRLRRIAIGSIAPGALVDGSDLLSADLGYHIDNMEGLSVHTDAGGAVILTLISDDNFNHFLQRTVLLQFRLVEE
jgi:hypothetical protein